MHQEFVYYGLALTLKAKGFNQRCLAYYDEKHVLKPVDTDFIDFRPISNELVKAPLWQQAISWLDKKEIYCTAELRIDDGLFKWYPVIKIIIDYQFKTIELKPRYDKFLALSDSIINALDKCI